MPDIVVRRSAALLQSPTRAASTTYPSPPRARATPSSCAACKIVVPPPITFVPRAKRVVLGVCGGRGQLVTVLDLRACLEAPPIEVNRKRRILLGRTADDELMGLLVDEVRQVVRMLPKEIESQLGWGRRRVLGSGARHRSAPPRRTLWSYSTSRSCSERVAHGVELAARASRTIAASWPAPSACDGRRSASSMCREIVLPVRLSPLPEAPAGFIGAVDHRGEVVPILDLGLKLGFGRRPHIRSESGSWCVLRGRLLGIVVAQVFEVFRVEQGHFVRPRSG